VPRLLVAAALLALAVGCSRPGAEDDGVRLEMSVTPRPPAAGSVQIEIRIRDAQGRPLAATGMELEATMSHPGMVPTFATARSEQPDRWLAEIELTMGGDWVVLVDARLEDGRAIRRTIPLPGVEPR
jgi:hypothetical protein